MPRDIQTPRIGSLLWHVNAMAAMWGTPHRTLAGRKLMTGQSLGETEKADLRIRIKSTRKSLEALEAKL